LANFWEGGNQLLQIVIVGLGGFIGSVSRFWLSSLAYRILGQDFPYGTLLVNVFGCFLIGFLMAFFEERFTVIPNLRVFLTIGILGGFTTFSSFSYETVALLREGSYFVGLLNVFISVFVCLSATWIGAVAGKVA